MSFFFFIIIIEINIKYAEYFWKKPTKYANQIFGFQTQTSIILKQIYVYIFFFVDYQYLLCTFQTYYNMQMCIEFIHIPVRFDSNIDLRYIFTLSIDSRFFPLVEKPLMIIIDDHYY